MSACVCACLRLRLRLRAREDERARLTRPSFGVGLGLGRQGVHAGVVLALLLLRVLEPALLSSRNTRGAKGEGSGVAAWR